MAILQSVQWLHYKPDYQDSVAGKTEYFLPHNIQSGSQPTSLLSNGTEVIFSGIKRMGRDSNNSLPSSV